MNSLEGICNAIDSADYHCCVNREASKMFCTTKSVADVIGIDTSNGANACDTRDTAIPCLPD